MVEHLTWRATLNAWPTTHRSALRPMDASVPTLLLGPLVEGAASSCHGRMRAGLLGAGDGRGAGHHGTPATK